MAVKHTQAMKVHEKLPNEFSEKLITVHLIITSDVTQDSNARIVFLQRLNHSTSLRHLKIGRFAMLQKSGCALSCSSLQ